MQIQPLATALSREKLANMVIGLLVFSYLNIGNEPVRLAILDGLVPSVQADIIRL